MGVRCGGAGWRCVFVCVMVMVVVIALTVDFAHADNKKKRERRGKTGGDKSGGGGVGGGGDGKGGGTKKCSKEACEVSAKQLEKRPYHVCCDKGVISDLSVRGHNGLDCQGLTPHLFVQMNSCFWKRNCTLTYSTKRANYMVKLYKGDVKDCVSRQADKFTIRYQCTTKRVKQPHIVRAPWGEGKGGKAEERDEKVVKEKEGVLVSHADHPWLYPRRHPHHHPLGLRESVTLLRPKKRLRTLVYTIRSLDLMVGDSLTVNWTADDVTWTSHHFDADHTVTGLTNSTFSVETKPKRVVFSLVTTSYTSGGEGFVICFRWVKKFKQLKDTCKKLVKTQKCQKGRGRGGRGRRRQEGRGGRNRKNNTASRGEKSANEVKL